MSKGVLMLGVLLAALAFPAAARASGEGTLPTAVDALGMLAQGVGVGAVVAFLFERIAFFQRMPADVKWWTVLALSVGMPALATVALQAMPAATWAQIEPYWRALGTGFLVWAGSQAAHKLQLM